MATVQKIIKNYDPRIVGEAVANFLADFVISIGKDVATGQSPKGERWVDFSGAGFKGLRRNEMIALARKYNLELNPELAHMDMIPIFEAWFTSGAFPIVKKASQEDVIYEKIVSRLMSDPAKLRAMADEAEKNVQSAPPVETVPDAAERPLPPSELSWNELQKYAKARGIDVLHKGRKQILAELRQKAA